MAHIGIFYIVMAYIVMAHIAMAYLVMVHIAKAITVMAHIAMASVYMQTTAVLFASSLCSGLCHLRFLVRPRHQRKSNV